MSQNLIVSMTAGKPYLFKLEDGSNKRIVFFGDGDGFVDIEIDGNRSEYSTFNQALGGKCIGFTEASA